MDFFGSVTRAANKFCAQRIASGGASVESSVCIRLIIFSICRVLIRFIIFLALKLTVRIVEQKRQEKSEKGKK